MACHFYFAQSDFNPNLEDEIISRVRSDLNLDAITKKNLISCWYDATYSIGDPVIDVDADFLDFGTLNPDETRVMTINLVNISTTLSVTVLSTERYGPNSENFTPSEFIIPGRVLAPGQSEIEQFRFSSPNDGEYLSEWVVTFDRAQNVTVTLMATVLAERIVA